MTEPVKEQLSACLDGELHAGELDLLLKQLKRDSQLPRSMGTYALIGEAMREQRPTAASAGFADRVAAAIAAEPAISHPASQPIQPSVIRWVRPLTGIAIAAGVAAMAVISLQPATLETQQIASSEEYESEAPSYTVPTNVNTTSGSAFIPAARLTNYVVAHSEYSSPLGRRTVLSGVLSDDDESQPQVDEVNVTGGPSEGSGGLRESQR